MRLTLANIFTSYIKFKNSHIFKHRLIYFRYADGCLVFVKSEKTTDWVFNILNNDHAALVQSSIFLIFLNVLYFKLIKLKKYFVYRKIQNPTVKKRVFFLKK